ncbi:MAG: aminopeptidase [Rhodospirillales bacterium]|nr:aminopeptidase [Rhodospirillales bacterium]
MTRATIDVAESADLVGRELLAIKPGENVAIVIDDHSAMEMVHALAAVAGSVGAECAILHQPSRPPERKNELSPMIEAAFERTDVLISLTGSGGAPAYAASVKDLLKAKRIRTMSMVMRGLDNFISGGALADYQALYAEGQRLAALWAAGRTMHITTEAGTDIAAPIGSDTVVIECGYATEPGKNAAFSDGEVSSRPLEGEAAGTIVIDGPGTGIARPATPIRVEVRGGRAVSVTGEGPEAEHLRHILETVPDADNIAEFGIGLNGACLRNGSFQEEKKARGNVHIAFGDNIYYGDTVRCPVHLDMVIYRPTVRLDDRVLVEDGIVRLDP